MDTEQLKMLCRGYVCSVEQQHPHPSNILSYSVAGKKFAYFKSSEPECWRFSLWVTPEQFLELTDQPGIKPARYMQRFHWVTIVNVQAIDEDYLKQLLDGSYHKAVSLLSKKTQVQLEQ